MENGPIQVSGPDIETAIERGLARLGLDKEDAEIEIVDPGSRGLLGIGARDAVVRLRPLATTLSVAQETKTKGTEAPAPAESAERVPEGAAEEETEDDYALSQAQIAEIAQQTLSELLGKMGIEGEVAIRQAPASDPEPPPITLDIEGEDLDALIGRHGEVLNALQYISRLIVSREVEHWVNLVVDVDRYKERRASSLIQLANRIAERVARTQQPVALEPMPPNERRAIHLALRDHPAVTTQSVGKGDNRKVTIIPRR